MSLDIQINNPSGQFALQNHDIVLDGIGSTIILTGQDKLIQDVQKILFTDINNFYNQYATQLLELIGTNKGIQGTINILAQTVGDSLAYLMTLQQAQVKYQQCQSSELIEDVLSLNINYQYEITNDPNDVRTFSVGIVLQTADSQQITVSRNVTAV